MVASIPGKPRSFVSRVVIAADTALHRARHEGFDRIEQHA
jgi:PleD family two-component response regulator